MVEIVLADQGVAARLRVVADGVSALAYLRGQTSAARVSRPNLILLDLQLPRQDGRALLAELKADVELRSIPVVVLTGSASRADIDTCYDLHACAFVTKPVDLHQFAHVIRKIERFFLTEVRLPVPGRSGPSSTADHTPEPFGRHGR
ncbi:response regulator [Frankia sp. R82]|nr:response regulator [Frankia sp. R82]